MKMEIRKTVEIAASPEKVWDTLTNPDKVQQYMFGSRIRSDWQDGSSLEYLVEHEGEATVAVRGKVIKANAPAYLETTIFPTGASYPDTPENHLITIYELAPVQGGTVLTITQPNFGTIADGESRYKHSLSGWEAILPKLCEIAENES